jgi:hypothetical protein
MVGPQDQLPERVHHLISVVDLLPESPHVSLLIFLADMLEATMDR